ncbi:MAG: hypothetical protein KF797_03085 [Flavobacteriales bacterium]|nr:hypothetical protein [Flavobacteriales bacterium]
MKTLFALVLPLLLLTACSKKRDLVATDPEPQPTTAATDNTPETVQHPVLGGSAEGDSLVFSLQRTPCFGACKAYVVNVYRSGYATYVGQSNVDLIGSHYAYIGPDMAKALLDDAAQSGFFSLNDVYDRDVTDLPSSIMRVVGGGRDKRVVGRVGTPESFKLLVQRSEEKLLAMPWKELPKGK